MSQHGLTTAQLSTPVEPTPRASIRSAVAVGIGSAIEWYDYFLYSFIAGLIIAPLFFPSADGAVGVLAAFATFAVGFIARPFGGLVLGGLGDRWGRRPVLLLAIIMVGAATALVGVLPTYATIGVWAPIFLVLLRLVQGFGAGAELAGAITIVNESATRKKKGFFSSLSMAGASIGSVVAIPTFTVLSASITPEAFLEWGWRVPFLLSAVFTVIGIVLRRKLHESPEFERVKAERRAGLVQEARVNPFVAFGLSVKANPRNWFAGFLIPSGLNVTGYVVSAFGITYLITQIGIPQSQTLLVTFIFMLAGLCILVFFGWLSDKIGAKRVMFISVIGGILTAFPYFLLLSTGDFGLIVAGSVLLWAFGWSAGSAAHTVLMPALFRPEYRGAGLFSSRELQGAIIAGPAPFIATALLVALGGAPWLIACLLIAAQVLTLIGLILGRPFLSAQEKAETPALRGLPVND